MSGRAGRASGRSASLTARGPGRPGPRQALGVGLDCAGPQVLSFPYLTLPASSVDFPDHWAST